MEEQLLLFSDSDNESLKRELNKLREQCEKLRKGHFVRYNQLVKQMNDYQERLGILESNICKTPKSKELEFFSI